MVADSLIQENPPKYEGSLTFYRADGSKEKVQVFKSGKLVKQTYYNPDGSIAKENYKSLHGKGIALYQEGSYPEASEVFEKAKIQATKEFGKKHPKYAHSCYNLAVLYETQGFYTQAEPLYKEAKNIQAEVLGKKHPDYAKFCHNLGQLYQKQGFYTQAEPLLIEAKNIQAEVLGKKHPDYANSCNHLASLYVAQGFYTQAEPLLIEAKNIQAEVLGKKHPDYANSCHNLAILYNNQGFYTQAELLYIEAKNIRAEVLGKKHLYYAHSCYSLAGLYSEQGFYTQAELLYIEAKNIFTEIFGTKHRYYAHSCDNLASLYQKQGFYTQAELLYIEAKNIRAEILGTKHPDYAISCNNLASLYDTQGLYIQAEPLYKEAKNIRAEVLGTKHPAYASSCHNLAELYSEQGFYSQAAPLYKEAVQNKLRQIEILLPTFSETERKQYLQSIEWYFKSFYHFSAQYYPQQSGISADLFDLRLQIKGLLFQSFQKIQQQVLHSGDSTLIAQYNQWKDTRNELAKVYELSKAQKKKRNIEESKLKAEAEKLEKELSQSVSNTSGFQTLTSFKWQDVQKQLQKKEALIEIVRVQDTDTTIKYLALIITPDTQNQPDLVVLENGKDLEKKFIKYYRNAIKYKRKDKYSYNQFWKAIEEKLPLGIKGLYFSPDGVYHQLNLETLRNPEDDSYLSDAYEIQVLGSPKDLITYANNAEEQQKKLKGYQLYLFGYPLYNNNPSAPKGGKQKKDRTVDLITSASKGLRFFSGGKISLLPGTRTEVENIDQIAQQKKITTKVFLAEDASEENLKQIQSPDILHIATHGFFLSNIPKSQTNERGLMGTETKRFIENPLLRAGLLFAGAEANFNQAIDSSRTENGILTAEEALSLDLNQTDLVVLSACETGLGEISNGEGVYGLQRAFQQAGAKTVLMSLWTVSDEATQQMMTYFYENLLKKKQDKRTAFRNAQQQLREDFPEPYYWGAFVMIGE